MLNLDALSSESVFEKMSEIAVSGESKCFFVASAHFMEQKSNYEYLVQFPEKVETLRVNWDLGMSSIHPQGFGFPALLKKLLSKKDIEQLLDFQGGYRKPHDSTKGNIIISTIFPTTINDLEIQVIYFHRWWWESFFEDREVAGIDFFFLVNHPKLELKNSDVQMRILI